MVHVDVKKVGRIPTAAAGEPTAEAATGQGRRTFQEEDARRRLRLPALGRRRLQPTRLHRGAARRESQTAIAYMNRAKTWFAAHGITRIDRIVTDNGACYRAQRSPAILGHASSGSPPTPPDTTARWSVQPNPRGRIPLRARVAL